MRVLPRFPFPGATSLLLAGGLLFFAARLPAQSDTAAPTPAPSSDAATTPLDANGSTLFPNGGAAAPELEENRAANRAVRHAGRGGRQGRGFGQVGRATDLLSARAASDPITVRIAFRKAKTEALLRYPGLAILERQAAAAGTDREKRAYLRAYYTQLYTAVKKVDSSPSLVSHVALLSQIAEQRYDPKRRAVGGDEDLVRGGRGGRGRR